MLHFYLHMHCTEQLFIFPQTNKSFYLKKTYILKVGFFQVILLLSPFSFSFPAFIINAQ